MGSFLSITLLTAFGYVYPAFECFKAVENNNPETHQLRFWCQYWILVAILIVCEKTGDAFVPWLPLYDEVKLAFFFYLWHPKWKGTTYVYNSFLRPYVVKHETEIDQSLFELKVKAGEVGVLYWHKAVSYGQTVLFRIMQYFSSLEPSGPYLDQRQQQQNLRKAELVASTQASRTKPKQLKKPLPVSSSCLSEEQSTTNEADIQLASKNNKAMILGQSCAKAASQLSVSRTETRAIQTAPTASSGNGGKSNSSQELQTSYNETVTKSRGIWRLLKSTTAH